jgi:hypothetical protein
MKRNKESPTLGLKSQVYSSGWLGLLNDVVHQENRLGSHVNVTPLFNTNSSGFVLQTRPKVELSQ